MMNNKNTSNFFLIVSILIFLFIFPTPLSAQFLRFTRFMYTDKDELIGGPTNIVQDDLGFLWISTWGMRLFRYDGQTYREYVSNLDDISTISASNVKDILKGQKGMIWFATSNGVSRFNSDQNNFIRYKMPNEEKSQLIIDIYEDFDGTIWVCNVDGEVFTYDEESDVFLSYTLPANQFFEEEPPVLKVFQDSSRDYWFVLDQNGVLRYSSDDDHFYRYGESPGTEGDLSDYDIRLIYEDREKELWFGTTAGGLNRYDSINESFVSYPYNQDNDSGTSHENIWDIYEDTHGNFWIATTSGLNLMNRKNETFQHYYAGDNPESLSEDWIASICEDKGGNLWFGAGYSGLNMFNPKTQDFDHMEPGLFVWSIYEDDDQMLWIGTEKEGLHRRDLTTGEKTVIKHDPDDDSTISNNTVYHMFEDSQHYIWVGTSLGLNKFDRYTEQFTRYYYDDSDDTSIPDQKILILGEDSFGTVWIGTGNGLAKYNRDSDSFTPYFHDSEDETSLSSNTIYSILDDSNGNLWVGTWDGLNRMADGSKSFIQYQSRKSGGPLIGDVVSDVYEGSDGSIYVSAGGFHKWIPEDDTFISISKDDGLPDNSCSQIFEDNSGNLWISTYMGIVKVSPDLVVLETYTYKDGLQDNDFSSAAGWKNEEGYIYFAGWNGISRFLPENITPSTYTPPVVLTSLRIFDEEILSGPWISTRQSIDVAWDENFFSFQFAAFDYRDSKAIEYAYKLEGYDEGWKYPGNRSYAGYTNIPGGKYNFVVKATNSDGIWTSEDNYGRLTVNIATHPLKTWWAISAYILLLLAVLALVFSRYYSFQQKKLIQERSISDRLRKVDNLKDQFLANTTHELRTPLNGIIGLAENLIDSSSESVPESTKKELSLIASSGRRLSFLINDILDLSRLKEGDISLNKNSMNLSRLVNTVLVLSKPLVAGKSLELINLVPDDLPPVEGDINRIQQILHNLIGNAIKFTPKGEIAISVRNLGSEIEITVKDTGIGIPLEKQNLIWQSFQQIDGSSSREYSGTGLGLPITKQLVEMHRGTIRLESEEERGSSFIFTLPVSEQSEEIESEKTIAALQVSDFEEDELEFDASIEELGKVLFIDDDSMNRHVLVSQLNGSGYLLKTASSGEEAILQFEEFDPDLILLDIMMPIMDGYEVCRKIREQYTVNELPVILITAKNQVADLVEGLSAGANDFISKPYSRKELLARIETHLVVKNTHAISGRFVPNEQLKLMGKKELKYLQSGDKIEREMSLMMADMGLTNGNTGKPSRIFDFFSSFVEPMLSVIKKHNGIIDGYRGDSLMGLFPQAADEAIKAAIELEEALIKYNREKRLIGSEAYEMGIVLHRGTFILGTIGTKSNMKEALISDSISVVNRMNQMSRNLSAPLLASETILNPENCFCKQRLIGKLSVSEQDDNIDKSIKIYEILSGEGISLEGKLKTKDQFEKGINNYFNGLFEEASLCLRGVLEINPEDAAAVYYREKAIELIS